MPYNGGIWVAASAPIRGLVHVCRGSFTGGPPEFEVSPLAEAAPQSLELPIDLWPSSWTFQQGSNAVLSPITAFVNENGGVAFDASVLGGNWLKVTPTTGPGPASLTLTPDPTGLAPGTNSANPYHSTRHSFDASRRDGATLHGNAHADGYRPSGTENRAPGPGNFQPTPAPLSFVLGSGSLSTSSTSGVTFCPNGVSFTASAATVSGGKWLAVQPLGIDVGVNVTASARNLAPGTYQGAIQVNSTNGYGSVTIPVTLVIMGTPDAQTHVTVSPTSYSLSLKGGDSSSQTLTVNSGGTPVAVSVVSDRNWFAAYPQSFTCLVPLPDNCGAPTPATFSVSTTAPARPGTYHGNITVQWPTYSSTIPVTLEVAYNPAQALPAPLMSAVVSAESFTSSSIAPGEMVTLFGAGLRGAAAQRIRCRRQTFHYAERLGGTDQWHARAAALFRLGTVERYRALRNRRRRKRHHTGSRERRSGARLGGSGRGCGAGDLHRQLDRHRSGRRS
jgi:hypothetical protein